MVVCNLQASSDAVLKPRINLAIQDFFVNTIGCVDWSIGILDVDNVCCTSVSKFRVKLINLNSIWLNSDRAVNQKYDFSVIAYMKKKFKRNKMYANSTKNI